jgi:hypothetical protein
VYLLGQPLGEQPLGLLDDLYLHPAQEVGELVIVGEPRDPRVGPAPFDPGQQGVERGVGIVAWAFSVVCPDLDHLAIGSLLFAKIRYPSMGDTVWGKGKKWSGYRKAVVIPHIARLLTSKGTQELRNGPKCAGLLRTKGHASRSPALFTCLLRVGFERGFRPRFAAKPQ